MKKLLISIFALLLCGCQLHRVEFVEVVHNHEELTIQVTTALIKTINDELEEMRPMLSNDEWEGILDLLARLEMVRDQSIVISDYVDAVIVDDELLARLIRNRWKEGLE